MNLLCLKKIDEKLGKATHDFCVAIFHFKIPKSMYLRLFPKKWLNVT